MGNLCDKEPEKAPIGKTYIYILECQHGCWYVGKTTNLTRRLLDHKYNRGGEWTKLHPPIEKGPLPKEYHVTKDHHDESNTTIDMMRKHGIDKVRGGAFCKVSLSESDIRFLKIMIASNDNKCYKCDGFGHYSRDCKADPGCLTYCSRCGRDSHTIDQCYATYHIYGYQIPR